MDNPAPTVFIPIVFIQTSKIGVEYTTGTSVIMCSPNNSIESKHSDARLGIASSRRQAENLHHHPQSLYHHPQSVPPAVTLWLEDECVLVPVPVMQMASVSYITLLSFAETSAGR